MRKLFFGRKKYSINVINSRM